MRVELNCGKRIAPRPAPLSVGAFLLGPLISSSPLNQLRQLADMAAMRRPVKIKEAAN